MIVDWCIQSLQSALYHLYNWNTYILLINDIYHQVAMLGPDSRDQQENVWKYMATYVY